jgi:hypothetical protein
MTFDSPLLALGLFFIASPEDLFEGDIQVVTSAGTASNSATPFTFLADGGEVFFIGLISDAAPFIAASIAYGPDVDNIYFEYNVDDITTAAAQQAPVPVPEPSTMLLTSTMLAAFFARRRSLGKR